MEDIDYVELPEINYQSSLSYIPGQVYESPFALLALNVYYSTYFRGQID